MANLIPAIDVSGSALSAERTRLEVVAQNIANAQVTHNSIGQPYRRKQVIFEAVMADQMKNPSAPAQPQMDVTGVRVSKIVDDETPFIPVYMPGHPDADAKGMVRMPNVNVVNEMVDMITANRSFEANLEVIKSARQMVTRSIAIAQA